MTKFPTSMIDKIKSTFNYQDNCKFKKLSPCRIAVDGKFIITNSGKTAWKRTSDAKNAIRFHLENTIHELVREYFGEKSEYDRKLISELFKHLYDSGTIKVVPISYEDCLKTKVVK